MKKKLLVLFVLLGPFLHAQNVTCLSRTKVNSTETGGAYHPTVSPTGDYLLITGDNYAGLKKYDLATKEVTQLTKTANAGYEPKFTKDGQSIIYRKATLNDRHLRSVSLEQMNIKDGSKKEIMKASRDFSDFTLQNDIVYMAKANKVAAQKTTQKKVEKLNYLITIENQQLVLYKGSKRVVLSPNGKDASYIWPSISPDKKNISSTIEVVSIDGQKRQVISDTAEISMYPTASADGTKVAYNNVKGDIYILKVSIQ